MRVLIIYILITLLGLLGCKSNKNNSGIQREIESDVQSITSASSYKNASVETLPDFFFEKKWVEQLGDNKGKLKEYKPLPESEHSSLYLEQFIFYKGDSCTYRWLAPNDAHEIRTAQWTYFKPKLFILENKVDIIEEYVVHSIEETKLVMRKISPPLDLLFGKWHLLRSNEQDLSHFGYTINIKGSTVEIGNNIEVLGSYSMSHSPRKLQEPLALRFDNDISRLYPWLKSGPYGLYGDTLVVEIGNNMNSLFIRKIEK